MQQLTDQAYQAVLEMSQRYGVSVDAVCTVLAAVNSGGGTMAQFGHPELGGSVQWMQGGMTMIGDMFNGNLKALVINLCGECSALLANMQVYPPPPSGGGQSGNWWPGDLGIASSVGGQNDMRYAVFPQSQRLAMERLGQVTVYDTLNHQIGGVQQQNGVVSFSSQFGTVYPEQLPVVSGADHAPPANVAPPAPMDVVPPDPNFAPAPSAPTATNQPNGGADDPLSMLERLGALHRQGVVSDEEFERKKSDLLSRL